MSMNHDYETGVALSDSVKTTCEENTMKSYPVGNKSWLSRKPCAADTKLLWITIRKS